MTLQYIDPFWRYEAWLGYSIQNCSMLVSCKSPNPSGTDQNRYAINSGITYTRFRLFRHTQSSRAITSETKKKRTIYWSMRLRYGSHGTLNNCWQRLNTKHTPWQFLQRTEENANKQFSQVTDQNRSSCVLRLYSYAWKTFSTCNEKITAVFTFDKVGLHHDLFFPVQKVLN